MSPRTTFSLPGGGAFTIDGVPRARDALVVNAGLNVVGGQTLNLSLSYMGQVAQHSAKQAVGGDLVWRV